MHAFLKLIHLFSKLHYALLSVSEYLSFERQNNRFHLQKLPSHLFCLNDFLPKPDVLCPLPKASSVRSIIHYLGGL